MHGSYGTLAAQLIHVNCPYVWKLWYSCGTNRQCPYIYDTVMADIDIEIIVQIPLLYFCYGESNSYLDSYPISKTL